MKCTIYQSKHFLQSIILFICFGFYTQTVYSQAKTGVKLLAKEDYEGAFAAFQTDLNSDGYEKIVSQYNIAQIYMSEAYANKANDSAYVYIVKAEKNYNAVPYDNKKKVQKIDANVKNIKRLKREIAKAAAKMAEETATIDAYNHFLTFYKGAERVAESKIEKLRNIAAYKTAVEIGQAQAFEDLLATYKDSYKKKNKNLYVKIQKKHFEHYMREKSWDAYDDFAEKFTYNVYVRDSMKTNFDKVRAKGNLQAYKDFIMQYSESLFVKIAVDSIAAETLKSNNIEDYDYFVGMYPKQEDCDDLWLKFYDLYKRKNGKESIKVFKYTYVDFPRPEVVDAELKKNDSESEKRAWMMTKSKNGFEDYHTFINEFPLTDHLQDAVEGMYKIIVKDSVISQHEYFLDAFPKHARSEEMWERLYGMTSDQFGDNAILVFDKKYPDFPFKNKLKADKKAIIEKRKAKKK
ncbi:MAG: hypothetical protein ACPG5B_15325 [Chitinophagales bacterium]